MEKRRELFVTEINEETKKTQKSVRSERLGVDVPVRRGEGAEELLLGRGVAQVLSVDPGVELLQGLDVFCVGDPALRLFFFREKETKKGEILLVFSFRRKTKTKRGRGNLPSPLLPPSRPPPLQPWPP